MWIDSLVDELKTLPRSDYSRGSVLEKELKQVGEELQSSFDRNIFEIPCSVLDGDNRGYEKDFPAKYQVRAYNPSYDIVIQPIVDEKVFTTMYDGKMGSIEGHDCKVMNRVEAWNAYDSLSR